MSSTTSVSPPGALVIGGAHGSLAIVRSLGRQGIPVWVLTNDQLITRFSRYTRFSPAWPRLPEDQQVDYLLDLAAGYGLRNWLIFPGGDAEVALIARHHDRLAERFRLVTPPWEITRWAYDKRLTYQLADRLGIDHPWTHYATCRIDVANLECTFPVILKPAVKEQKNEFTSSKAWRADNMDSLLEKYDRASRLVDPATIMIQELIPGGGEEQFSYCALWTAQGAAGSLTARRTRQYPIDFGFTSTYVETVCDPAIAKAAEMLLDAMGYLGLVEVEFKRDRRDGRFKLLDVNARLWQWISLGSLAGVHFPYLQWQTASGSAVANVCAQPNVRWIHVARDIAASAALFAQGTLTLSEYMRSLRGPITLAAWAKDDPIPGLVDMPLMAQRLWKRIRTGTEPTGHRAGRRLSP